VRKSNRIVPPHGKNMKTKRNYHRSFLFRALYFLFSQVVYYYRNTPNRKNSISVIPSGTTNDLSRSFEKFGTDKGGLGENVHHNYDLAYSLLFSARKLQTQAVLEIGIGTTNATIRSSMGPNGVPGASLQAWKEFFPNARIYGADIDKEILFNEDRIDCYFVDQDDPSTLNDLSRELERLKIAFDIIVDDGLHTIRAATNTFLALERLLAIGGIYVIEDVPFRKWGTYAKAFNITGYQTYCIRLKNPKSNRFSGDNSLVVLLKNCDV
jgi:hypothetical protein